MTRDELLKIILDPVARAAMRADTSQWTKFPPGTTREEFLRVMFKR